MSADPMERVPPHDIQAEIYSLACILDTPAILTDVTEILLPEDFYRPLHADLYRHMILLWAQRQPVTLVTLRDSVRADPDAANGAAGYIPNLAGIPVVGSQAPAHARIVWKHSVRRRMIETGTRMVQRGYELDFDPAENLAQTQKDLDSVARETITDDAGRLMSSDQFLRLDTTRTTPVIPGLLWHEERVIIVGVEGDGKTTLGMQVGYAAAAGRHPFQPTAVIPPMRVMLLDFENPRHELHNRIEFFSRLCDVFAPGWSQDNLTLMSRPEGVDLTSARDRILLADKIRQVGPDLIVGGPLYKMVIEKGESAEPTHSQVTRFWDVIRGRHGSALWFETHPPLHQIGKQRVMRPLGSGIYSRWPEFGINLMKGTAKQEKDRPGVRLLEGYRRHRDRERVWPEMIAPNRLPGLQWPWDAVWPQGTLTDQP